MSQRPPVQPLRVSENQAAQAHRALALRASFALALVFGIGFGGWAGFRAADGKTAVGDLADLKPVHQEVLADADASPAPRPSLGEIEFEEPLPESSPVFLPLGSLPDDTEASVEVSEPSDASPMTSLMTSLMTGEPRVRIALVIDDLGLDQERAREIANLPARMTLSYLTYADNLQDQTDYAWKKGHEIFAHVPMQPAGDADPGPNALMVWQTRREIHQILEESLPKFSHLSGVNNHMGSLFTANEMSMSWFMADVEARGLYYLDSVTAPRSRGASVAAAFGLPEVKRDVFIDHHLKGDGEGIAQELLAIEALARQRGEVIAIGHPYPGTLDALRAWIPAARERGIEFVAVSDLDRVRGGGRPSVLVRASEQ